MAVEALSFLLLLRDDRGLVILDVGERGGVWQVVKEKGDDCVVVDTLHQVLTFKLDHLRSCGEEPKKNKKKKTKKKTCVVSSKEPSVRLGNTKDYCKD